jgi:hypothetical protein
MRTILESDDDSGVDTGDESLSDGNDEDSTHESGSGSELGQAAVTGGDSGSGSESGAAEPFAHMLIDVDRVVAEVKEAVADVAQALSECDEATEAMDSASLHDGAAAAALFSAEAVFRAALASADRALIGAADLVQRTAAAVAAGDADGSGAAVIAARHARLDLAQFALSRARDDLSSYATAMPRADDATNSDSGSDSDSCAEADTGNNSGHGDGDVRSALQKSLNQPMTHQALFPTPLGPNALERAFNELHAGIRSCHEELSSWPEFL